MVETFYQTTDLDRFADAIAAVVALDGYVPVRKPTAKTRVERADRRIDGHFEQEELWGMVLIPGNDTGWTYVTADPVYCLCERPRGVLRPRLAEIARRLGCEAVMINTYDSCDAILLESRENGNYHVSGSTDNLADRIFELENEGLSDEELQTHSFPFFSESVPYAEIDYPQFYLLESLAEFNSTLQRDLDIAVWEIRSCLAGVSHENYEDWSGLHLPFRSYRRIVEGPHGNWSRLEADSDLKFPEHRELYFKRSGRSGSR